MGAEGPRLVGGLRAARAWFIDDLMKFCGQPHYVALLSAAALHGAVYTSTTGVRTETGTIRVSTPEATALDLLRYLEAAGHLGNVVTVLAELAEKMDAERLADIAKAEGDVYTAQRLGYLLEQAGAGKVGARSRRGSLRPRFRAAPIRSPRAPCGEGRSLARAREREGRGSNAIPRAHITAWHSGTRLLLGISSVRLVKRDCVRIHRAASPWRTQQ